MLCYFFFFFNDTATTEIYTLSLHDALPISEFLHGKSASRAHILYGGSVESDNALSLANNSGIDGFLVGHASAEPESFTRLVMAVS